MKIAIVSTIEETIPPTKYGGVEWIVFELAEGLAKRGHDVHLFASGDSPDSYGYKRTAIVEKSIRTIPPFNTNGKLREIQKYISYAKAAQYVSNGNFDIVHNHAGWRFLFYTHFINRPVVTTIHSSIGLDYQQFSYGAYKNLPFVSISNNQRNDKSDLNFAATVYNGTRLQDYQYSKTVPIDAPMFFLARFSSEKGGIPALQVAAETGKKLRIAAKIDTVDKTYFQQAQSYLNHPNIEFIGEIDLEQKAHELSNARCLMVPIQWEEPFGLMFTEAMASGTPVITYSRGSAPEIIRDGITGFLVNQSEEYIRGDFTIKETGIDGLKEAVKRIYEMPEEEYTTMRAACRQHVEQNFSDTKMVDGYEKLYAELIKKSSK